MNERTMNENKEYRVDRFILTIAVADGDGDGDVDDGDEDDDG